MNKKELIEKLIPMLESLSHSFSEIAFVLKKETPSRSDMNQPSINNTSENSTCITREELYELLSKKASEGHTQQVKDMLHRLGAKKLSQVDPSDFKELYSAASIL